MSNRITSLLLRRLFIFVLFAMMQLHAAAPLVTSTPVTSANEDAAYNYILSGSDADGDWLEWNVTAGTSLPSWLTLSTDYSSHDTFVSGLAGSNHLAYDSAGNLYIADSNAYVVLKVTPDGNKSVFSGTSGSAGCTGGLFNKPFAMAVDGFDNLYVSSSFCHVIYKITPDGTMNLFAGAESSSGSADGNATTEATFNTPKGLTFDDSGNLYVADTGNHIIRKVTPEGIVSTFAGSGGAISTDGTGTDASFNTPHGITFDGADLYVTEAFGGSRVRKVTLGGVVTTLNTGASFNRPADLAADRRGNLYIADTFNNNLRKLEIATLNVTVVYSGSNVITAGVTIRPDGTLALVQHTAKNVLRFAPTLSGTPVLSDVGVHDVNLTLDDGNGNKAYQNFQIIVNEVNYAPTAIDLNTTTFDYHYTTGDAIAALSATDPDPSDTHTFGLTCNTSGADDANFTIESDILKANADFAGTSQSSYAVCIKTTDNGGLDYEKNVTLSFIDNYAPTDIALSNTIFNEMAVASTPIGTLSSTDPDTGDTHTYTLACASAGADDANFTIIGNELQANATFAGSSQLGYTVCVKSTDSGGLSVEKNFALTINKTPSIASTTPPVSVDENGFYSYSPIATDANGDALTWSVTQGTSLPSWLELHSNVVTTFAGSSSGHLDGSALSAQFTDPRNMTFDSQGNLFVSEQNYHIIRKITPEGNVTTFAGTYGASGTADGVGSDARFNYPAGMACDSQDNLFVADRVNQKIRKITPDGNVTTFVSLAFYPQQIVIDANDTLYVIRGGIAPWSTINTYTADGASGTLEMTMSLSTPVQSLAIDDEGSLYVASSSEILRVAPSGATVRLAGDATTRGYADGVGATARFNYIYGLAYTGDGVIYASDYGNSVIRRIAPNGNVTTVAGTAGVSGYVDAEGSAARFQSIWGMAFDGGNSIYICNSGSSKIRKLTLNELVGTPTNSDVGVHDINLTVNDGSGGTAQQNFQITVNNVNETPTAINLSNDQIIEGNAIDAIIGTLSATDADLGDTHTFTLTCNDANFSVTDEGILSADISFAYDVTPSQDICVHVVDSANASFDQNFTVSIFGKPRTSGVDFDTLAPTLTTNAGSYVLSFNVTDPESDDLAVSVISSDPSLISVTPSSQNVFATDYGTPIIFTLDKQGSAIGVVTITVTISGATGETLKTFDVTVENIAIFNPSIIMYLLN